DPHGLLGRQMAGPGAMIALEVAGGFEAAGAFVEACDLVVHAVSLGGADTLIQHPASLTHRPVTADAKPGDGLVRLSVGLEHIDDLAEDLFSALDSVRAAA
ncbi:PLP-dependent transferase, partial [Burkholderia multivorans]|uniref:PLP-dependent transferase n=1 Tax=Burkholderia multivorans TaxID=87883 RepID=UPI000DB18ED5